MPLTGEMISISTDSRRAAPTDPFNEIYLFFSPLIFLWTKDEKYFVAASVWARMTNSSIKSSRWAVLMSLRRSF